MRVSRTLRSLSPRENTMKDGSFGLPWGDTAGKRTGRAEIPARVTGAIHAGPHLIQRASCI